MNRRPAGARLLDTNLTDVGVVNSTTQTEMAKVWLPRDLEPGDLVRLRAYGDLLNNSGSAVTYALALIIGATSYVDTSPTTIASSNAYSVSASANRAKWRLQADLLVTDAKTNSQLGAQRAGLEFMLTAQSATAVPITTGAATAVGYGSSAVDLTRTQPLLLAATLGTANASADMYCRMATWELLRP